MVLLRVLAFLGGAALVAATLFSALQTFVVPRAESSAITRLVFVNMRRVFGLLAHPRRSYAARDRVMAFYAPICLILLPAVWVVIVMTGFTAMFWAVAGGSWGDAYVVSGSSLLTLGFQREPGYPGVTLSFVEATLGLALIALLISYLPSIYSAFNRRENLVGMLEIRAGVPPSPAEALIRYNNIGMLEHIDDELFPLWEQWFMDVEESHTSLPALVFFRSPQPHRNWVTAGGCVLDMAALMASVVDGPRMTRAPLCLRTGFFCFRRVADYFEIPHDPDPKSGDPISITRSEFDELCAEIEAAGVLLKGDRDRAWRDYAGWRVNYDAVLVALAAFVMAPPARWSSDRVPERRHRSRVIRHGAPKPRSANGTRG